MKPAVMDPHPIRAIRESLGLTRVRFAKLCGVTRETVQLSEAGRIAEPRKIIDALARLGLHPDVAELARDCRPWAEDDSARLATDLGLSVAKREAKAP